MKITRRDTMLLLFLLYVLIIIGGFMLLIKPQMSKTTELENKQKKVKDEKAKSDAIIAKIPTLKTDIEQLVDEIKALQEARFFTRDEIRTPEVHIDTLFPKSSEGSIGKLLNLHFDVVKPVPTDEKEYVPVPGEDNKVAIVSKPAQSVQNANATATVTYRGTIENLVVFADRIQQMGKMAMISSVYIEKESEENTNYKGTFVITFTNIQ